MLYAGHSWLSWSEQHVLNPSVKLVSDLLPVLSWCFLVVFLSLFLGLQAMKIKFQEKFLLRLINTRCMLLCVSNKQQAPDDL